MGMQFRYDTHMHSTYSDGDYRPADVAERAYAAGLRGAVLTDHNTIAGQEEFMRACKKLGLETFMGVEIGAKYGDIELHILGYAREFDTQTLEAGLQRTVSGCAESITRVVELLRTYGVADITLDDVRDGKSGRGVLTRYDVTKAIARQRGLPPQHHGEIIPLIKDPGPIYVPYGDHYMPPVDACRLIAAAGGVSVIAHPAKFFRHYPDRRADGERDVRKCIRELIAAGLRGIECRSYVHTSEDEQFFRALADTLGLVPTGGSDWHGEFHHPKRRFAQMGCTEEEFFALEAIL